MERAMKIGFHLSVAQGFTWTYKEAKRLGCQAIQVFVKNPRSWATKIWRDEEVEAFKTIRAELEVFAHLSYLPNLAKIDLDERHLAGFVHEVELCVRLGIETIVVHCGSRPDTATGLRMTARAIDTVLADHEIKVLIENASGQGNAIGKDISELSRIYSAIERREKVGLCLDTAHLFESGYNIRNINNWNGVLRAVREDFGTDKIGLLHLNDSKTDLGSRVDRHWHIGKGKIGTPPFRSILNDIRFIGLCGVMETPKAASMDEENMKTMRSLLSPLVPRSSS
jgi:deoxyribonuclease IV